MVAVASSSRRFSSGLRSVDRRRRRRWAESWIGVSVFLISWAMRCATSRQAARRWALRSSGQVVEDEDHAEIGVLGSLERGGRARSVTGGLRAGGTSRSSVSRSRFMRWMSAASSE